MNRQGFIFIAKKKSNKPFGKFQYKSLADLDLPYSLFFNLRKNNIILCQEQPRMIIWPRVADDLIKR